MTKEKAEKIVRIYNWVRFIILIVFLTFVFVGVAYGMDRESIAYDNCGLYL